MRIVDAMALRDGGTTCVTVEHAGVVIHVTADHRLRPERLLPRFVFLSRRQFGRARPLLPGGPTETFYVKEIARAAVLHLGADPIRDFLTGRSPNQNQGTWFYVLNFLWIVNRSRLRNVLSHLDGA